MVSMVSATPWASFATVFDVAGAISRKSNSPSWSRAARKGELALFSTKVLGKVSLSSSSSL